MTRLKAVSPSMEMMLETTSRRLFETKSLAHFGSPDKDPDVRLRVLEDAGRLSIPFTSGLLVGIGETLTERAETIFALRKVARTYGGLQEVIVQNFRAKPDTAMRQVDDLGLKEYRAAIAVTRLVLGPPARVQAPPNLTDLAECRLLLEAGVDDWGGVSPLTPDHVNPERPWPALDRLRELSAECGFDLTARLTVHPEYVAGSLTRGEAWLDPVARPGPSMRDNRAVHAMARIMLQGPREAGGIDHVQTSWVKLGVEGTRVMLQSGADDLGGTLMEETISRMAGSQHGSAKTVAELVDIGAAIGRPAVQRTTTYDRCPMGRSTSWPRLRPGPSWPGTSE